MSGQIIGMEERRELLKSALQRALAILDNCELHEAKFNLKHMPEFDEVAADVLAYPRMRPSKDVYVAISFHYTPL